MINNCIRVVVVFFFYEFEFNISDVFASHCWLSRIGPRRNIDEFILSRYTAILTVKKFPFCALVIFFFMRLIIDVTVGCDREGKKKKICEYLDFVRTNSVSFFEKTNLETTACAHQRCISALRAE